jgi:putative phage-type endonuclease
MLTLSSREEWLEKRQSYIGGSEAACIVGLNPYSNNVELWERKTGRIKPDDISDNPYVRYGTEAERYLRELFALDFPRFKVEYIGNNMWINSDYPFAHASLDGWLTDEHGRKGILEIKTTNIQNSSALLKWKDKIPDNYFCQVCHYLAVTGFDFVVLKAQLKWDHGADDLFCQTRHYFIEREEVEDDIKMLMSAELKFSDYIKADIRPPLVLPMI